MLKADGWLTWMKVPFATADLSAAFRKWFWKLTAGYVATMYFLTVVPGGTRMG